jgi:hypothetical protein
MISAVVPTFAWVKSLENEPYTVVLARLAKKK